MPNYTYLIIGGGMTGDAALHGIREVDRTGPIGLIGAERTHHTTARPSPRGSGKVNPWRAFGARPTIKT